MVNANTGHDKDVAKDLCADDTARWKGRVGKVSLHQVNTKQHKCKTERVREQSATECRINDTVSYGGMPLASTHRFNEHATFSFHGHHCHPVGASMCE